MKETLKKIPLVQALAQRLKIATSPRFSLLRELPRHSVGAEVGVHVGDFSEQIINIVAPRKLYLIDPWKYEVSEEYKTAWYGGAAEGEHELDARCEGVKRRFAKQIRKGTVEVVRQSSAAALSDIEDDSLDFVYIDGNHLYDFVKEDLELSLSKVKSGGFITGDDYGPGSWWEGGVKRAVDAFGWKAEVSLMWIVGGQFVFKKH